MKYLTLFVICLNSLRIFGQTPPNDPNWQLVWVDHFNWLNPNKWTVIDWADGNEETLYLADNVKFENGKLVITVNNNDVYCPPDPPTVWGARGPCINGWYSNNSGWVESKQAFNTQYGYIESRIKLPFGHGFFPAFWTFVGKGVQNNSNVAEIDIFEMLGNLPASTLTTNIHKNYPDDYRVDLIPTNFDYTNWHNYAIEWSPSKIIWYVDGAPVRLLPNHGIVDPIRIILNLAIDPNTPPNSSTPCPSEMLIDYV
jgi:beta-glucanase (GH16 family)